MKRKPDKGPKFAIYRDPASMSLVCIAYQGDKEAKSALAIEAAHRMQLEGKDWRKYLHDSASAALRKEGAKSAVSD